MFSRSGLIFQTTRRGLMGCAKFRGLGLRQMVPAAAGVMAVALGQQVMALASSSSAKKPPTEDKPFVVKSSPRGVRWTFDEDQRLREGVKKYGRRSWTKISEALLPHRKPFACYQRWTQVLDPKVKNGIWSPAEDARLTDLVGEIGEGKWAKIAEHGRENQYCLQGEVGALDVLFASFHELTLLRWTQNIDPSLNHETWSAEEDAVLLEEYALHPNKWITIRERLPGRSDRSIRRRHRTLTKPEPGRIIWTAAEDDLLTAAVDKHSAREWAKVAEDVPGRASTQCALRWTLRMAQQGKTMAAWSPEDDALLRKGVEELGTDGKWAAIAEGIPGKSGIECKIRWERELSRTLNADPWSSEEDATIKRMREESKRTHEIFSHLPGRTRDAIVKRCEELGLGIQDCVRWTNEENEALRIALLSYEGKRKDWDKIAEQVSGKTAKQCRDRAAYGWNWD